MTDSAYSIAILAGGKSRRMGQNKALIEIGGIPLLERVINAVRGLSPDIFLVTNEPDTYRPFNLPMLADVIPGKAALGGIYSAVFFARNRWVFTVACDMPLLRPEVINFLAGQRENTDIVIPLIHKHPETLHAFYSKQCLWPIYRQIRQDRLKVTSFFDDVRVNYVKSEDLLKVTSDFNFAQNLNTEEDIANIETLL